MVVTAAKQKFVSFVCVCVEDDERGGVCWSEKWDCHRSRLSVICLAVPFFDLRLPNHRIPPITDSFMCTNFTLPIDPNVEYHIIAFEALITHVALSHHIATVICLGEPEIPDNVGPEGAWECPTMAQVCATDLVNSKFERA